MQVPQRVGELQRPPPRHARGRGALGHRGLTPQRQRLRTSVGIEALVDFRIDAGDEERSDARNIGKIGRRFRQLFKTEKVSLAPSFKNGLSAVLFQQKLMGPLLS